jgi:hypothetical protein
MHATSTAKSKARQPLLSLDHEVDMCQPSDEPTYTDPYPTDLSARIDGTSWSDIILRRSASWNCIKSSRLSKDVDLYGTQELAAHVYVRTCNLIDELTRPVTVLGKQWCGKRETRWKYHGYSMKERYTKLTPIRPQTEHHFWYVACITTIMQNKTHKWQPCFCALEKAAKLVSF